jgi:hypothetical protein
VTGWYVWWNSMPRQGRTGWTLIVVSVGYLMYFVKARLFEAGPEITRKEWFYVIAMLVLMVLGTINVRMAEMRQRKQGTLPLLDPRERSRK